MNAEIITTGTEILLGEIVDTNAAYMARQLRAAGVNLYYKTTVGDNRQRLAETLRLALSRSDVILVTGGLGPTVDDVTREAVAAALGRPLQQRPELVEHLRAMFGRWGRELTENNLRQAFLPEGATVLENPIGTAPGFLVMEGNSAIMCMPGVPREMQRMMADHVLPYLQERMGDEHQVICTRILHTAGIGESAVDDLIGDLMAGGNPTVGLAAHLGRVDIRLAARAPDAAAAELLLAPLEAEVRRRLRPWIYGAGDDTLGSVVAQMLRERRLTLALVETNTSGRVHEYLQETGDGSVRAAYIGSRTLADLADALGLSSPPKVDEHGAIAVAARLQERTGAHLALALLGTSEAGQGFWSADRGSTWVALATAGGSVRAWHFGVGGSDEFSRNWLAIYGLNLLRKHLQEEVDVGVVVEQSGRLPEET